MPETIADALSSVPSVDDLIIVAIERDANTLANYDIAAAVRLVTLKFRYTEAVHALRGASRPSVHRALRGLAHFALPGSTTVSTVNAASSECQFARHGARADSRQRNSSGIIGDSPFWEGKDNSP